MQVNNKLTLIERIIRMMADDQFRKHCEWCKNNNPNFEYEIKIAERIASLDIKGLNIDENLIHMTTPFSEEEVDSQILAFYKALDEIYPNGIQLSQIAKENMQYLSHDAKIEDNSRSYCCSKINEDGTEFRKIFAHIEGRIGDISNACHEVCHSISKTFTAMKPMKDKNMSEVATVMVDALSAEFMKKQYPNLKINIIENAIHAQIQNIIKAREVLLDGLVIKLMIGEITLDELQKKYGDLYLNNTRILNRCLDNIETYKFTNMFEKKYLLPQAISQIMLERFKNDPTETIKQFKTIIENDTELTVAETLKSLNIGSINEVFNNYVCNFAIRTQELTKERNMLQKRYKRIL